MGYRTVVMLSNDLAYEWENDPLLGKKIATAMQFANNRLSGVIDSRTEFGGGCVVECVHADTQTLAVLDSLGMNSLSYGTWRWDESTESRNLRLVKDAAEKLGYKLTKLR